MKPSEEKEITVTLGEIFPAIQGNTVMIEIKTTEGEKVIKGTVFPKNEKGSIVIGDNFYEQNTLVTRVMAIRSAQEETS